MSKHKINSLNGRQKNHSILRELVPLLEGLLEYTAVNSVGTAKIVHYASPPDEKIELRGYDISGKRHHLKIRLYADHCFQEFYLYCRKDNFKSVWDYLINYVGRKDDK